MDCWIASRTRADSTAGEPSARRDETYSGHARWAKVIKQVDDSDPPQALERLKTRYRLVVLSNGEPHFLDHLAKNRVRWKFDEVISVQVIGAFKPHPGIYLRAAGILRLEVNECLMVSANSFDVMGARACGYRGAFVNRYGLPYEDSPYQPDVVVKDFKELADALL